MNPLEGIVDPELKRIVAAFAAAHTNGFGFQTIGVEPDGSLVLGFLSRADRTRDPNKIGVSPGIDEREETKVWQSHFGTDQIHIDEWIGRTFLQIHWTQYHRIPELIQYALDRGFKVQLQNYLQVVYNPGDTFDPEKMESRFIRKFREDCDHFANLAERDGVDKRVLVARWYQPTWKLLCEWNWQTPEGKAFCRKLQEHVGRGSERESPEEEERLNFFQWPIFTATAQKHRFFQYADWWWGPRPTPEEGSVVKPKPEESKTPPASASESRTVFDAAPMANVNVIPTMIFTIEDDGDALDHVVLPPNASVAPEPPRPTPPIEMCILCQDNIAVTKVLPCEHTVVCLQCSDKLQSTPDRAKCLRCRRPITAVLCDGVEPYFL